MRQDPASFGVMVISRKDCEKGLATSLPCSTLPFTATSMAGIPIASVLVAPAHVRTHARTQKKKKRTEDEGEGEQYDKHPTKKQTSATHA